MTVYVYFLQGELKPQPKIPLRSRKIIRIAYIVTLKNSTYAQTIVLCLKAYARHDCLILCFIPRSIIMTDLKYQSLADQYDLNK